MKTTQDQVPIMEKIVGMSVTKHQARVVGVDQKVGAAVKSSNTMDVMVLLRLKNIILVQTVLVWTQYVSGKKYYKMSKMPYLRCFSLFVGIFVHMYQLVLG